MVISLRLTTETWRGKESDKGEKTSREKLTRQCRQVQNSITLKYSILENLVCISNSPCFNLRLLQEFSCYVTQGKTLIDMIKRRGNVQILKKYFQAHFLYSIIWRLSSVFHYFNFLSYFPSERNEFMDQIIFQKPSLLSHEELSLN